MTRGRWPAPRRIVEQAGFGWGGLWILLDTAGRALVTLGAASPTSQGTSLILFARQLHTTSDAFAEDFPGVVHKAIAVDLGPIDHPTHLPAAREMVVQLLSAVLRECNELLAYDPDIEDRVLLGAVNSAAWNVREGLSGSIPNPSLWD